jgi:hypothetical protein
MTTRKVVVKDTKRREVKEMPYYGMGFGRGFGFRGYSPSWPYVGRGRGGLPRCWAYGSFYPPATTGWPAGTPETEINLLKNQAQILKQQLDLMESRIKDIEQK